MESKFQENKIINKNSSVFIATFSHYEKGKRLPTNGMVEPLLSFFLPKVRTVLLLDQPHLVSDTINPIVEVYRREELKRKFYIPGFLYFPIYLLCRMPSKSSTRISYKLRDFFSVLFVALTRKERFDFFIGLESINTFAGIFLRMIGRVNTVIYYVSDYSPARFGKTLFNTLYLWLDQFCVKHADFTWDVSPAMKEARIKEGILQKDSKKILHVPNGLFDSQIDPLPISKRIPESIAYMGLLNRDQGIDLALKAFKLVHEKKPDAKFHIIGGANRGSKLLTEMIKDLDIEESVIFHGFVPPNEKMSSIIGKCYIGIAAYKANINPRNRYGDSGKIRQYLGCGLPIVATTMQWYTRHAIEKGAGIGVAETPEDFAKAILKLFDDKELYKRCSEKAIELSKGNTWENNYSKAFLKMQELAGN